MTRLRRYIRSACAAGASSPEPPDWARRISQWMVRASVWVQVGRVRVLGPIEQLAAGRPCVVAANHGHYADGLVIAVACGFPSRCFTFVARGALTWAFGLGALCVSPSNTVCVDLRRGHGTSALRTGVRLLTTGHSLVIFPEGWAHMDGHRGPFHTGAAAMAQLAARKSGARIDIVPVAIRYPRHPGAWITRWPPALQYAMTLLAFPLFRRGATMAVGTAIDARTLSLDPVQATRTIEAAIDALRLPYFSAPGVESAGV